MSSIYSTFFMIFPSLFGQEASPELPSILTEELQQADQMGDTRFFAEFLNMLIYLGALLAVMMLLMFILKKMLANKLDQTNRSSGIKVLEKRQLTPKTAIYILHVLGKEIAIAEGSHGVTKLGEIPAEEEPEKHSPSFNEYMKKE